MTARVSQKLHDIVRGTREYCRCKNNKNNARIAVEFYSQSPIILNSHKCRNLTAVYSDVVKKQENFCVMQFLEKF